MDSKSWQQKGSKFSLVSLQVAGMIPECASTSDWDASAGEETTARTFMTTLKVGSVEPDVYWEFRSEYNLMYHNETALLDYSLYAEVLFKICMNKIWYIVKKQHLPAQGKYALTLVSECN